MAVLLSGANEATGHTRSRLHTSPHPCRILLHGQLSRASISRFGGSGKLVHPWLNLANDFKIDTCRFLAMRSTLLGHNKDWLAQRHNNVTERDIRLWC